MYKVGDDVVCINTDLLRGNYVAPPLKKEVQYTIQNIILDRKGNQHLDVGLKSEYNYISSYETKEHLIDGNSIHWCHPSRFKKVEL